MITIGVFRRTNSLTKSTKPRSNSLHFQEYITFLRNAKNQYRHKHAFFRVISNRNYIHTDISYNKVYTTEYFVIVRYGEEMV